MSYRRFEVWNLLQETHSVTKKSEKTSQIILYIQFILFSASMEIYVWRKHERLIGVFWFSVVLIQYQNLPSYVERARFPSWRGRAGKIGGRIVKKCITYFSSLLTRSLFLYLCVCVGMCLYAHTSVLCSFAPFHSVLFVFVREDSALLIQISRNVTSAS